MARPTNYEKTIKGGCQVATLVCIPKFSTNRHITSSCNMVILLLSGLCFGQAFVEKAARERSCFVKSKMFKNSGGWGFSRNEAIHKSTKRHKLWWFTGAGTSAQTPLYRLRLVCYGLHKMASFLLLCPLPGYDGSPEQAQMHKLLHTGCV